MNVSWQHGQDSTGRCLGTSLFCAILKASQFNQRERTRCCRCTELLNMTQRTSESVLSQTHVKIHQSLRAGMRTDEGFPTNQLLRSQNSFSHRRETLCFNVAEQRQQVCPHCIVGICIRELQGDFQLSRLPAIKVPVWSIFRSSIAILSSSGAALF